LKIVFDTSVLIAAFYKPLHGPSFSKDVYDYIVENDTAYISPEILEEFQNKCIKKIKLSLHETESLVSLIRMKLQVEEIRRGEELRSEINLLRSGYLRDLNDLHVVELAVTVHADMILSWDKYLLVLQKIGKTKIITPREFWDFLK
jgi:putative PIN family toxin of toxin-antitoxin system